MFIFSFILLNIVFVFTFGNDNGNINTINHIPRVRPLYRNQFYINFKQRSYFSEKEGSSSLLLTIISKQYVKQEHTTYEATTSSPLPSSTTPADQEAPCLLHSIREGCICRYGDRDCDYPPILSLLNENYFL